MNWDTSRYYLQKLVLNSPVHKLIAGSCLAFLSIIQPGEYIIFSMLFWLWIFSMIFWTINGSIKNWFNMRKFLMWGVKIITYGMLIYFAKALWIVTHIDIWVDVFAWFMIFELLLSVLKHCAELGLPMPWQLIRFVMKQEKDFEEKFMGWDERL